MNLGVNFMVIKDPFSQGYAQSHVFVVFFLLSWSCYQRYSGIIAIVQYSKTDHRWADNRDKRLGSLCVQVSSFMECVGYGMTHLTTSLYEKKGPPQLPLYRSIIYQTHWIFQEGSVICLEIFIDNRLPCSSLIGFQTGWAADEKWTWKAVLGYLSNLSVPQTLTAWPSLWWIND